MRRAACSFLAFCVLGGGIAAAQTARAPETAALAQAKSEAEQAMRRSAALEQEAARATDEAARARAEAEALVARIEAAEADRTAAEARIGIIEARRIEQRARLAERQGPVIRLTAALQTMSRRPPALALVQPGSVDDLVRMRSLLASTLPVIRERTADLRAELAEAERLRGQAELAAAALAASREQLQQRRIELAEMERAQRRRSAELAESALAESDRALAFGEEARELARQLGTREAQERLRTRLAELPGPLPRPVPDAAEGRQQPPSPRYLLPVAGRLVTGVGEVSDSGIHSRGLTFETPAGAEVVAPAGGRVAFAGRFRGYGEVLIIDHGGGWSSVVTNLAEMRVAQGQAVRRGAAIGRTGEGEGRVTVELRRHGRPVPITPLLTAS